MGARIAAIVHEYDRLTSYRLFKAPQKRYMLCDIFEILKARGCSITVLTGLARHSDADIAILHVDTTHVPDAYTKFGQRFPCCINLDATNIAKSVVSEILISRTDGWKGPVIVKTDLNTRGGPEARKNSRAAWRGRPLPFPGLARPRPYATFRSSEDVPVSVWDDPALVVEPFLPERLPDGFGMCHYVFCGEYEFCARFVGTDELVKGKNVFRHEIIPVPEPIRNRRRELGFDYGKFDFVHHEGKAYLLDANKTPGLIPPSGGASLDGLADGFLGLLAKRS